MAHGARVPEPSAEEGGPVNPERYAEVCAAFERALSLDEKERASLLESIGRSDPELRGEVEELLTTDAAVSPVFEEDRLRAGNEAIERMLDAATDEAGQLAENARLGPYRVLDVLGQGGMGTVYLCEQIEPIRRRVALKVVKLGMDSKRIIQRFSLEQEALERMEHPGIARLLDAGVTPEGRPFFAMEHVDGSSLIEYCDEHMLGITERLRIMVRALRALHHAHLRGILHRDLKPSNILVATVDGKPRPKIIDFGLARAVDPSSGSSFATLTGEILGTPAYMSPEQFEGDGRDIDVRSDVYSMSVLLFELLTGRLPIEARDQTPAAALMLLRSRVRGETPMPSSKVRAIDEESRHLARKRDTNPRSLHRLLRGELDWIVLRAMELDRDRRYGSAAELADDIEAHLDNRPVVAGPPELTYRLAKFIRRRRLSLSAAALVLLSMAGGTVAALLSARDARAAEREMGEMLGDVQAQNDILYQMLTRPDPRFGGKDTKVVDLLAFGSEYALENYGDRPEVLTTVMGSLGGNYRELGMYAEAERHLRLALEFQLEANDENHARVAFKMNGLAILLKRMGRLEEAEKLYRQAIERHYRVENHPAPHEVGVWEFNLGRLLADQGRWEEAREMYLQSLRTHREFDDDNHVGLGLLQVSLGELESRRGAYDDAERALRGGLQHLQQVEPPAPHFVASAQVQLGRFLSDRGRREEAGPLLESAVEAAIEIQGAESPSLLPYLDAVAHHRIALGGVDAAEELVLLSNRIADRHLPPDGLAHARAVELHGQWLVAAGRGEEARSLFEGVLEIYEEQLAPGDTRTDELRSRIVALR